MIQLLGVSKRLGDAAAVRDVTLETEPGELVAVLGASGSGKTTLLKMVNRLIEPDTGEVRIDGRNVKDTPAVTLRRTIGYVIQHIGLLPHMTTADNVAMVPRLLGWAPEEIHKRVEELFALVGLPAATYGQRFPDELSGGQRQRIGVARALAARPKALLLDEPFGALDPITRVALQREVKAIHASLKLTTLMVTHDILEALTMADRVAVMHQGRLRQLARPREIMDTPADDYVAELATMARRQSEELRVLLGGTA
jgi:osmoprotectant transport system ATP-binding protein